MPGYSNTSHQTTIQGNEVEDIISSRPPAWVRLGTVYLFIVLFFVLLLSWVIKSPDIVSARGVLTSINAPKEIITKSGGRLQKLFVKENQLVNENQVIGYIENTSNFQEVILLDSITNNLYKKIVKENIISSETIQLPYFENLGELQPSFQAFNSALVQFESYLEKGFFRNKRKMLLKDVDYLRLLHNELLTQRTLLSKDLSLTDSTFRAQEILKGQKVISEMDYRNEKSKLIAKQLSLPQVNSSIVSNESMQHEKAKEIAELENQISLQKDIFLQALNTIRSQISDWKKKYALIAPAGGKVSFNTFIQESQEMRINQSVCFVVPSNTMAYVESVVPQYSFGKIKVGQNVLMRFDAYPYKEFGSVEGKVEFISAVPADSGYLTKIIVPKGLVTTSGKELKYISKLTLQADIITQKRSLLERLFDNLRSKWD